jgi:hypothetical protein
MVEFPTVSVKQREKTRVFTENVATVAHKLLPRFLEPIPEEIDVQSEALEKINIVSTTFDPIPYFF